MSVYSAGSSSRASAGDPPPVGRIAGGGDPGSRQGPGLRPGPNPRPGPGFRQGTVRGEGSPAPSHPGQPSPLTWARRRITDRGTRRLNAAGQRAENQLEQLGPSWRVVEWPDPAAAGAAKDQAGFLAIGPGGVYAVTVVDHGRQRVMLAGDVVQIKGARPPYVAQARKTAKTVSSVLTAAVGTNVPVVPVLTFVGSGSLTAHGLPTGCLVVSHRELDRLLRAAGNKISVATARKLADVASHPATWADRYRWYPDSQTASDKRTPPR